MDDSEKLYVGDRLKNTFNGLVGTVVAIEQHYGGLWFYMDFPASQKADNYYVRNGINNTFLFTRLKAWERVPGEPAPMEDTRDYLDSLNGLMSLRAS